MRKVFYKILMFVSVFTLPCYLISHILTADVVFEHLNKFQGMDVLTYSVIQKASLPIKAKHVIVGDSTATQIFYNNNYLPQDYAVFSTNQGVTMAGQFLLLNSLMKNNSIDSVTLYYHPKSFINNIDQTSAYSNFIRPFYNEGSVQFLTNNTLEIIRKPILSCLYMYDISKTSPLFCRIDYSYGKMTQANHPLYNNKIQPYLSDVSIEYIKLINYICDSKKIKFNILTLPYSDSIISITRLNQQINANKFNYIFRNYLYSGVELDSKSFLDGIHFKKELLDTIRRKEAVRLVRINKQ